MRFGVIGYGKMGSSLVHGAVASGLLKPGGVRVLETDEARRGQAVREGLIIVQGLDNLSDCTAILLSLKPKDFSQLLEGIGHAMDPRGPLFISIAAGLRLEYLEKGLGEGARVVRVMPNLPASVNEAASVYIMGHQAREKDRHFMEAFLAAVGKAYELSDERLIDAVTGISGSGPAYFFMLMRVMESAALNAGLPPAMARSLIAQTCRGAGTLALRNGLDFDGLIRAVASPGGTTEEALKVLESRGVPTAIKDAISAAIDKSTKMRLG